LRNDRLDWRRRGAAIDTRETIISLMSERPFRIDAAALFWWSQNQLDLQQHVESDQRIRIIHYDHACHSPNNSRETDLPPDVEKLCYKTFDSFAGRPEL
jgi:O-succinylbenzoate synthase